MGQADSLSVSGTVAALLVATAPDTGVQAAEMLWRVVAGRPLITWPLRALAQLGARLDCALVAPTERADDAGRLLAAEAPACHCAVATPTQGGWRGALLSGLAPISGNPDWLIVLDATLPLVTTESLRAGLRVAAQTKVAIAGEPVKETLKRVNGHVVVETPPRDTLRRLLSPVILQREALSRALRSLDAPARAEPDASDLVALAQRSGAPLTVYEAGYPGVRVTSEADLAILEMLLRQRSPEAH